MLMNNPNPELTRNQLAAPLDADPHDLAHYDENFGDIQMTYKPIKKEARDLGHSAVSSVVQVFPGEPEHSFDVSTMKFGHY